MYTEKPNMKYGMIIVFITPRHKMPRGIVMTSSSVCLSVCLSVHKTLSLVIFKRIIYLHHWYFTCSTTIWRSFTACCIFHGQMIQKGVAGLRIIWKKKLCRWLISWNLFEVLPHPFGSFNNGNPVCSKSPLCISTFSQVSTT